MDHTPQTLVLNDLLEGINAEDPNTIFLTLKAFHKQTKEDEGSLAWAYATSSPQLAELFRTWQEYRRDAKLALLIAITVDCMADILDHAHQDAALLAASNFAARKVLRSHLKWLYSNLAPDGADQLAMATLRLMRGMVSLSLAVARDFRAHFNFSFRGLAALFTRTTPVGDSSVRHCYLAFMTTLVEMADTSLTRNLMSTRRFLTSAFAGLAQDPPQVATAFLECIRTQILTHRRVPTQAKADFFNAYALGGIARAYELPPGDARREAAHALLKDILGVIVVPTHAAYLRPDLSQVAAPVSGRGGGRKQQEASDIAWGVSRRNLQVLSFLRTLQPTRDSGHRQLTLHVLAKARDLVHARTAAFTFSLEPRPSLIWFSNMSLMTRLLSLPVPLVSGKPLLAHVIPARVSKASLTRALLHERGIVQVAACAFITAVFERYAAISAAARQRIALKSAQRASQDPDADGDPDADPDAVESATDSDEDEEENETQADPMAEDLAHLGQAIRAQLPDFQTLLRLFAPALEAVLGDSSSEHEIRFCAITRVLADYQRYLPGAVSAANVTLLRLLPGSWEEMAALGVRCQGALLRMVDSAPRLRWWTLALSGKVKARDAYPSLASLFGLAHLHARAHPKVASTARHILFVLLAESGLFQANPSEITHWIDGISRQDTAVAFLQHLHAMVVDASPAQPFLEPTAPTIGHYLAHASPVYAAALSGLLRPGARLPAVCRAHPPPGTACALSAVFVGILAKAASQPLLAHTAARVAPAILTTQPDPAAAAVVVARLAEDADVATALVQAGVPVPGKGVGPSDPGEGASLEALLHHTLLSADPASLVEDSAVFARLSHAVVCAGRRMAALAPPLAFARTHAIAMQLLAVVGASTGNPAALTNALALLEHVLCVTVRKEYQEALCALVMAHPALDAVFLVQDSVPPFGVVSLLALVFGHTQHLGGSHLASQTRVRLLDRVVRLSLPLPDPSSAEGQALASLVRVFARHFTPAQLALVTARLATDTAPQPSPFTPALECVLVRLTRALQSRRGRALTSEISFSRATITSLAMLLPALAPHAGRSNEVTGYDIEDHLPAQTRRRRKRLARTLLVVARALAFFLDRGLLDVAALLVLPETFVADCMRDAAHLDVSRAVQRVAVRAPTMLPCIQALLESLAAAEPSPEVAVALFLAMPLVLALERAAPHLLGAPLVAALRPHLLQVVVAPQLPSAGHAVRLLRATIASHPLVPSERALVASAFTASEQPLLGYSAAHMGVFADVCRAMPQPRGARTFTHKIMGDLARLLRHSEATVHATTAEVNAVYALQEWFAEHGVALCVGGGSDESDASDSDSESEGGGSATGPDNTAVLNAFLRRALKRRFDRPDVLLLLAQIARALPSLSGAPSCDQLVQMVLNHSMFERILLASAEPADVEPVAAEAETPAADADALEGVLDGMASRMEAQTSELQEHGRKMFLTGPGAATQAALVFLTHALFQGATEDATFGASHLPLFLGAYSASLAVQDTLLLQILYMYEARGHDLFEGGYGWGSHAQTMIERRAGASTTERAVNYTTLLGSELIGSERIERTLDAFPMDEPLRVGETHDPRLLEDAWTTLARRLLHSASANAMPASFSRTVVAAAQGPASSGRLGAGVGVTRSLPHGIYDPAFMLTFFAHVAMSDVRPRQVIEAGGLALGLRAMSSSQEPVRRLGYEVVALSQQMIEGHKFAEQQQIELLLEVLRNSITEPFQRVPSVMTLFLARASRALLHASHFLYGDLNRFLLQRPAFDFGDVPLFYGVFFSNEADYKRRRAWMLGLLSHGVHTYEDLMVLQRRHVFELVMSFVDGPVSDTYTRTSALTMLEKAVSQPALARNVVGRFALVPWLTAVVGHTGMGPRVLTAIVNTATAAISGVEASGHIPALFAAECAQFLQAAVAAVHAWLARSRRVRKNAAVLVPALMAHATALAALPGTVGVGTHTLGLMVSLMETYEAVVAGHRERKTPPQPPHGGRRGGGSRKRQLRAMVARAARKSHRVIRQGSGVLVAFAQRAGSSTEVVRALLFACARRVQVSARFVGDARKDREAVAQILAAVIRVGVAGGALGVDVVRALLLLRHCPTVHWNEALLVMCAVAIAVAIRRSSVDVSSIDHSLLNVLPHPVTAAAKGVLLEPSVSEIAAACGLVVQCTAALPHTPEP